MAYRFRKSVKIAPGVRLNKSGSVTVGKRGSSVNFGSRGVTAGIPGTGLRYSSKISQKKAGTQNTTPVNLESKEALVTLKLQDDGSVTFQDENGNPLSDDYILRAKRQNRELISNWLQESCDEINEEMISLVNIHLTTPSPDTEITFIPTKFSGITPTMPGKYFEEPQPTMPVLGEYNFLAKKVKFFQRSIDKINNDLQENYEQRLEKWVVDKADFEANYVIKHEDYLKKLEQYNISKLDFKKSQEERKRFIEEDRLNDPSAMEAFLEESLQTLVWPRETLISYDVINEGKEVLLDVDLPEIEDLPVQQAKVNKRDQRLTYKDISETQKRKNYFAHIHAIGFRLIGEVFISLPSVATIVFSGYSQRPSKTTGKIINEYLYSVRVQREKWEEINFQNLEKIDVVSCFEEFELRREATKTGVITPVEPF